MIEMNKEIIKKYLNNQCTLAELEQVIRWAKTAVLENEGEKWGLENWKDLEVEDDLDDEKFDILFDKIQQKINSDVGVNRSTESETERLTIFTKWLTRVAAILMIPVLGFLFYTLYEIKVDSVRYAGLAVDSLEIAAPIGSRTVVHLSDGSEVHLNYGSKLKYPQVFIGDTREVSLTGEGYFKVAHNPEKPFIVSTGEMKVKALGTTFNVLAYADNPIVETTLVEGKVVLELNENETKVKPIGTMVPGQHTSYNLATGKISSTYGKVKNYVSWKDGKLVFEDTPISQVAEKLGRMYNVEIELEDEIKDYYYTVTFVDEPLFQILDLMAIATPIIYRALPREKLADGTFTKQKIIIGKRM